MSLTLPNGLAFSCEALLRLSRNYKDEGVARQPKRLGPRDLAPLSLTHGRYAARTSYSTGD